MDYDYYDDEQYQIRLYPPDVEDDFDEPRWTVRRVLYLIIALLIVTAFLVYMLAPLIQLIQQRAVPEYLPVDDLDLTYWLSSMGLRT